MPHALDSVVAEKQARLIQLREKLNMIRGKNAQLRESLSRTAMAEKMDSLGVGQVYGPQVTSSETPVATEPAPGVTPTGAGIQVPPGAQTIAPDQGDIAPDPYTPQPQPEQRDLPQIRTEPSGLAQKAKTEVDKVLGHYPGLSPQGLLDSLDKKSDKMPSELVPHMRSYLNSMIGGSGSQPAIQPGDQPATSTFVDVPQLSKTPGLHAGLDLKKKKPDLPNLVEYWKAFWEGRITEMPGFKIHKADKIAKTKPYSLERLQMLIENIPNSAIKIMIDDMPELLRQTVLPLIEGKKPGQSKEEFEKERIGQAREVISGFIMFPEHELRNLWVAGGLVPNATPEQQQEAMERFVETPAGPLMAAQAIAHPFQRIGKRILEKAGRPLKSKTSMPDWVKPEEAAKPTEIKPTVTKPKETTDALQKQKAEAPKAKIIKSERLQNKLDLIRSDYNKYSDGDITGQALLRRTQSHLDLTGVTVNKLEDIQGAVKELGSKIHEAVRKEGATTTRGGDLTLKLKGKQTKPKTEKVEPREISFAQFAKERGIPDPGAEHGTLRSNQMSKAAQRAFDKRRDAEFAELTKGKEEYRRLVDEGQIIEPKHVPQGPEAKAAAERVAAKRKARKEEAEKAEKVTPAKEPWEMTKKEIESGVISGKVKRHTKDMGYDKTVALRQHWSLIKKRLSEGKPVPDEVLKDYPDLAKGKTETTPTTPKTEHVGPKFEEKKKLKEKIAEAETATPAEAIQDVKEGVAESNIGIKESREKILAKIDEALKNAPKSGNEVLEFHIPGDGDFKINNTVAALTEFKKRAINSLKEKQGGAATELYPKPGHRREFQMKITPGQGKYANLRPFPKFKDKGVPHEPKYRFEVDWNTGGTREVRNAPVPRSPRKFRAPNNIVDASLSHYTDGHYIIKKSTIKKKPTQLSKDHSDYRGTGQEMLDKVLKDNKKTTQHKELDEVGRIPGGHINDAIFYDGKNIYVYDARYIDYLHNNVKDFHLLGRGGSETGKPGIIMSGDNPVGLLMPLRMGEDFAKGLKIEPIKGKLKGKKAAASGVAGSPAGGASGRIPKNLLGKDKRIGVTDIRKYISESFDIPLRTGHFKQKASGIYKIKEEAVRTDRSNNLATISHELGHHLDKVIFESFAIKGSPKHLRPFKAEMMKLGKDLYGKRKPNAGYQREGFAEYIRHWLTTEKHGEVAPKFTKYFDGEFMKANPETAKVLKNVRQMVKQWREQGAVNEIQSMIAWGDRKFSKPTKKGITLGIEKAKEAALDQFAVLEYAEGKMVKKAGLTLKPSESPTVIARATGKTAHGKAATAVYDGTFDFTGHKTGESLRDIISDFGFKKLKDPNLREAIVYAVAKHGKSLHKRGINPGFDMDVANAVVSQLKGKWDGFAERFTAWNNRVLDYYADPGVGQMTPKAARVMRELNPFYIPFKRAFEEAASGIIGGGTGGKRFVDLPSPIKKIKGSGRDIINPLTSMARQAEQMFSIADKARMTNALIRLSERGEGLGIWIEEIPAPTQAMSASLKELSSQLKKAKVDLSGADLDAVLTIYGNAGRYFGKENIVTAVRGGKLKFYELHPELYRAVRSMDVYSLPPFWNFILGKPARLARLGYTGVRGGFAIANLIRDTFTSTMQSENIKAWQVPGRMKTIMAEVGRQMKSELYKADEVAFRLKATGVELAQPFGLDIPSIGKRMHGVFANTAKARALHVVKHPLEAMRRVVGVTEMAPRRAEYKAVLKKLNESVERGQHITLDAALEAVNASNEVSLNFKRMGRHVEFLNTIIPFFNATLQGPARMYRAFKAQPVNTTIKALSGITAPSIALWMMNKDEEWWQELPDWQKWGFWNLKVGEQIIKVPMPFEWGLIFGSLPVAALDAAYRKDPKSVKSALNEVWEMMLPSTVPTAMRGAMEVFMDYDMFRERAIVPYFMEKNKEPYEQHYAWTPKTYKALGKILGYSPLKIEHLAKTYTGDIADDLVKGAENIVTFGATGKIEHPADLPVLGRFFSRPKSEQSREYEKKERKNELYKEVYDSVKRGGIPTDQIKELKNHGVAWKNIRASLKRRGANREQLKLAYKAYLESNKKELKKLK